MVITPLTLLAAATTTATSPEGSTPRGLATFQATGTTSAGAGAATVLIEVSNDKSSWITAGTITLVLSTSAATDGFAMDAAWAYHRARISAISGTNAAVTVTMGV